MQLPALVAQLDFVAEILELAELDDERVLGATYPRALPGLVRGKSYDQEYKVYLDGRHYDFMLSDRSLLQFPRYTDTEASFSYRESPISVPTYREFLRDTLGETEATDGDEDFRDDYMLEVATARFRESVTPVRYDYTPLQYTSGVHPAAHVHVGHSNEMRIATARLMKPPSFALFIVRHFYPTGWQRILEHSDVDRICRAVRSDLTRVDEQYVQDRDSHQLVLE